MLELGCRRASRRLTRITFGSLTVWYAGRSDLIFLKLYAAADQWPSRGRHIEDLVALGPSREELLAAARWAETHDPWPGFRDLVVAVLERRGGGRR